MKYYDFENWVAKELFDQPETVDTSKLTDKLFLYDVMSRVYEAVAGIRVNSTVCKRVTPKDP